MKFVILSALISVISTNVFAAPKTLRACSEKELTQLEASIKEWTAKDYPFAYYMKNPQGKTVGFYATDKKADMYAEVCDFVNTELVTSTSWYYWDDSSLKADPASWKAKAKYRLTQDEGIAYIKMIKADKVGKVTAQFQVMGFGESDDEILLMKEIVKFEPKAK